MQPQSTGFLQGFRQSFGGKLGPNDPAQMTYEQAKRRSALSGLLAQRVMFQQPQNVGQGLSAMTGAFAARRMGETADAALTAGREQVAGQVGQIFNNGQMPANPIMPSAGPPQVRPGWPGQGRLPFIGGFGNWGWP